MARRAMMLALALLPLGTSAQAGTVISGAVRYGSPAPCSVDECRLFLASQCQADVFVERSGTFASVVPIPPAARGRNGVLEWKLTGSAAMDTGAYAFISDDCAMMPGRLMLSSGVVSIPGNAAWFVFSRGGGPLVGFISGQSTWWRWREI